MGWGAAQKMVRYLIGDNRAGVKFFPKSKKAVRYSAGIGARAQFIPLVLGSSWEDVIEKLKALKVKAAELEAQVTSPPAVEAVPNV